MKRLVLLMIAGLFFAGFANAQEKAKWKEMDDFHGVMSTTFHPAEEGNLQPIRTRSQEMIDKATAWKASAAPAGYDKKAVKETLKRLVKGTKELHKLVKAKAEDKVLVTKLTSLHDVFHEIMEKCREEKH
jgi:hypothetical protein